MKKVLSVMLAVLMLFGALSIGASAVTQIPNDKNVIFGTTVGGTTVSEGTHAIVVFDFNGGSSTYDLSVYDTDVAAFVQVSDFSGKYIMLPGCDTDCFLTAGSSINTPYVEAPDGYKFNGWFCKDAGEYYIAGEEVEIQKDWIGKSITFQASYIPAKAEGDTMKIVLGVLTKVFGTILGILFLDGSSAAGIELVEKLLAGIM